MKSEPFRILLVEDNEADVYLFRIALLRAGLEFNLIVMEDGGKATAFVRGEGEHAGRCPVPDLAVIDLSLPKEDGIQVIEAIRADQRFADIPIVVTSSSAAPPARLSETHLRVARYITKPSGLEEFLQIGAALRDILLECPAGRTRR
jgi:CheY-like chemotaxis protein